MSARPSDTESGARAPESARLHASPAVRPRSMADVTTRRQTCVVDGEPATPAERSKDDTLFFLEAGTGTIANRCGMVATPLATKTALPTARSTTAEAERAAAPAAALAAAVVAATLSAAERLSCDARDVAFGASARVELVSSAKSAGLGKAATSRRDCIACVLPGAESSRTRMPGRGRVPPRRWAVVETCEATEPASRRGSRPMASSGRL
mmetsp:Transcript_34278/g.75298  ORF Transcript_34278/g.75298 Transcript_34278/m.75298 type:complete len:210 (-) Transcript_34278:289-918(-)